MAETRDTQTRTEQPGQSRGMQRSESGTERLRRRDADIFGASPLALFRRMQDDMDRMFGDLWGGRRQWQSLWGEDERHDWAPALEAFHRGNEFVVRADVPGLSRDDLSVEIGEDALTIRGERKYDHKEEREGYLRSERSYGTFCRVVPLPEGAMAESAKANFKDGVLEIVLQAPPNEVRRGRKIEIGEGGEKGKGSR